MGIGIGESIMRKLSVSKVVIISFATTHLSSADSIENPDTARLVTENKAYIRTARGNLAKSNMFLRKEIDYLA